MPVLVTGAETGLGRAVVRGVRAGGGEVRAWLDAEVAGDDEAAALRAQGCKVAVGAIDDEGLMELALEQVHTVVHCWGGPLVAPAAELDGLAGVVSAATGARCKRLIWPSHLGAGEPGADPYLAACAEAEELLADAPMETVVVRRALTYGPGDALTALLAGGARGVRPEARHAPLAARDLAAVLVRADAMERGRVRPELSVVVEVAGPAVVTVGELVTALRRAGVDRDRGALPATAAALYSRDLLPGSATLGREGTPLPDGVRAAAARA